MKKITINLDYTDFKQIYIEQPVFFFAGNKLIHKEILKTHIPDPTNENETIPIRGQLIYSTTLEVENVENIVISFEDEVLENTDWGDCVFDLFLENLIGAMGAVFFRIKGHYQSYFLQLCYGLSKRYRLISNEDATFNITFCSLTKDYPVAGLQYENSEDAYVEEYFRPHNFEEEYQMYRKSVVWDTVAVFVLILLCIGLGLLLNTYRAAGVSVILFGFSAIIFPIRNLTVAKKQFSKLKNSNWNLDEFVNR